MIAALLVLYAAQDPVDERLTRFRAALEESRGSVEAVRAAFGHLIGERDDRLRDEAIAYLRKYRGPVREAAAEVLREYRDDPAAAAPLFEVLRKEAAPETAAILVDVLAHVCPADMVSKYVPLLTHADPTVASVAVSRATRVRSIVLIEPLVSLVGILEAVDDPNALDYYAAKQAKPSTMQQRREACLEPARRSLRELTGQELTAAADWAAWWKENRDTFKFSE